MKRVVMAMAFVGLVVATVPQFRAVMFAESIVEILNGGPTGVGNPASGDSYTFQALNASGNYVLPFGFRTLNHSQYAVFYNSGTNSATIDKATLFPNMSGANLATVTQVFVIHADSS